MKKIIIAFLICGLSISAFSQTTNNSKIEKIKNLLEMTGSGKLGVQVANNMISVYQKSYNMVDKKFWDDFIKEIKAEDLVNLIIPIYDKYYTEDDIDQLTSFYNTPTGKKMIETLPIVTQESMTAGQAWGKLIGEKVIQQLTEKGYLNN
jgi:hypothetical protein